MWSENRPSFDRFLQYQTVLLVFLGVWSLGGRADGAITWMGLVAWSSLGVFLLDVDWRVRLSRVLMASYAKVCFGCWAVLIGWLLLAPFNAQFWVQVYPSGAEELLPQGWLSMLPSVYVEQRCREYGFFFSGVLVQAMVLWLYLRRLEQLNGLIVFFATNAIVAALVGAFFRISGSDRLLGLFSASHSGFFSSFQYHNHWTAFALLSMGQCLALVVLDIEKRRRDIDVARRGAFLFWFTCLALLSVTLPMSTARAGVVFLVLFWLGTIVYVWLKLLCFDRQSGSSSQWARLFRFVGVPALGLGLLVVSIWISAPYLEKEWGKSLEQIQDIRSGQISTVDPGRTDSWVESWLMLKDRPFFGWGYGSHLHVHSQYVLKKRVSAKGEPLGPKEFAHNDWMQYLSELGFVGFTLLLLPPILLFVRNFSGYRSHFVALALLYPCALILLLATFEYPLSNPAVIVLFFLQAVIGFKFGMVRA